MKIALFPGSFDPFTIAHQDLVDRALSLLDKVVIGVGHNINKKGLLDVEDRIEVIKQIYADNIKVEVLRYTGLTVDFCETIGAQYKRNIRARK